MPMPSVSAPSSFPRSKSFLPTLPSSLISYLLSFLLFRISMSLSIKPAPVLSRDLSDFSRRRGETTPSFREPMDNGQIASEVQPHRVARQGCRNAHGSRIKEQFLEIEQPIYRDSLSHRANNKVNKERGHI
jgi:hypothetical protein